MQLHPTRSTFHVAGAGLVLVVAGIAMKIAPAVAFGGAMLIAVTLGRALALVAVTRIRNSGFEMVWSSRALVVTAARNAEVVLEAELRNRGPGDIRGVNLRAVAASTLECTIDPPSIDLPRASAVRFVMRVRPKRVGHWGIHGIALEVRGTPLGGEGLYEVPLMFANPRGIEVMPGPLTAMLHTARGGRARRGAELGSPAPLAGDGEHLHELRERAPGDAFKRIAWKASARRGQLLVREMEREERDVVWLVLDASVELWAGQPGSAPLDIAVDDLSGFARRHLTKGDRVGLVILASRMGTWLVPGAGPLQAARIASALASSASMVDADRCELDELGIAARVVEHLRPLDPRGLSDMPRHNLDALSARAEIMRSRAPFAARVPLATSPRDTQLRQYLASFGIEVPPRTSGERDKSEGMLCDILEKIAREKKMLSSVVHVWAPLPGEGSRIDLALRKLRRAHVALRWTMPIFEPSLEGQKGSASFDSALRGAVRLRVKAARARAEQRLRSVGVVVRPTVLSKPSIRLAPPDAPEPSVPPAP
ncbi:MAG: DUF58 domain-containing protein [Polyangiaceae bacterium]|nr:DUF58 domain-containing protein [Polyangiaceae bacterium]